MENKDTQDNTLQPQGQANQEDSLKNQKTEDLGTQISDSKETEEMAKEHQKPAENAKKRDYFKQKFNVFFGYNGKQFSGSQKNPGVETVEDALEKALHQAGFISDDNFGDLHKTGWGRASRTDKGVHAAMNGVCTKLIIRDDFLKEGVTDKQRKEGKSELKLMIDREKVIAAINSVIHKDVHVIGNPIDFDPTAKPTDSILAVCNTIVFILSSFCLLLTQKLSFC